MRSRNNKITFAPTNLSNFPSCRHLIGLDLAALEANDKRPVRYGPMIDEPRKRLLATLWTRHARTTTD